jgi:eukaryotic-like serine/threonine-protein kinase
MCCPESAKRYSSVAEVLEDLDGLNLVDRTIGKGYRLVRYMGGKLGNRIYLAENLRQPYQSPCIIKQIQPNTDAYLNWQQAERRFHRELQTLQKLGFHEQIPSIWDSFEENHEFYLVQEFIDGESLQQKLEGSKRLDETEVISLLSDVLEILAFLHQHQCIHRQIKPSNLIRRFSDRKYVSIGFDRVKNLTDCYPEMTQTRTYSRASKIEPYFPPEEIVNRPVLSSDFYALGMTAIQALTGIKPEQIHTELRLEELFSQTKVKVNPKLTQILQKMIYLDCSRRYQSATAIQNDLEKLVKNRTSNLGLALTKISSIQIPEHSSLTSIARVNWKHWFEPKRTTAFAGLSLLAIGLIEIFHPIIRPNYYIFTGKQLLQDSPETALSQFRQAIAIAPKSSQALKYKGDAFLELERYTDALSAYDGAISRKIISKLGKVGEILSIDWNAMTQH